ncbi:MAG: sugar kinase [Roseobacter sp. MedPE-SW]|nr:MAG: sugar kinase [Roseobacter sp. MedPE-SW]
MTSTSIPRRIACVGEAMVELNIANSAQQIGFAGDVLNTAIYLSRGLNGASKVEFVSVLGQDALSAQMERFIRSEGVGTRRIGHHDTRLPGIYSIAVDADGERSFSYWRDQSAARSLFEDGFGQLVGAELIYLSGITLAILPQERRVALLGHLQSHPARIAFDSNYRPKLWEDQATARRMTEAAWRICDIALPSVDDEMALFADQDDEAVLMRLRSYGLRSGALKRGARGPQPIDPNLPCPILPKATNVVDTTAAGDSFNGAWMASSLGNCDPTMALKLAHEQATRVIAHKGAIVPLSRGSATCEG